MKNLSIHEKIQKYIIKKLYTFKDIVSSQWEVDHMLNNLPKSKRFEVLEFVFSRVNFKLFNGHGRLVEQQNAVFYFVNNI